MTPTHRVTLTIVLDVVCDSGIGPDALAVAHHRAESMAARVLLCGDVGGRITMTDEPGDGLAVPATARSATTMPGTMTVRVLMTKRRARKVAR